MGRPKEAGVSIFFGYGFLRQIADYWSRREALDKRTRPPKTPAMLDLGVDGILERANAEELRRHIRDDLKRQGTIAQGVKDVILLVGEGATLFEELIAAKRIPHAAEPAIADWLSRARELTGEPKAPAASEDNGHL